MKKFFALLFIVTLLSACSGDDSNNTEQEMVLLKKTIETTGNGDIITSNYHYDGNKLVSIIGTNGSSTAYTYTGNLITKIKYINPGRVDELFIEYDNDNRVSIITSSLFVPEENFEQWMKEISVYNPDGTITNTVYMGKSESDMEFNNSNTTTYIDENTILFQMGDSTPQYHIFDGKNNPMKNVLGYVEYAGSYFGNQNVLYAYKTQTGSDYSRTYTYNSNNYPVTSVEINYSVTSQKQFFYE